MGKAAIFIPGYECNSPGASSDFDRLISRYRLTQTTLWGGNPTEALIQHVLSFLASSTRKKTHTRKNPKIKTHKPQPQRAPTKIQPPNQQKLQIVMKKHPIICMKTPRHLNAPLTIPTQKYSNKTRSQNPLKNPEHITKSTRTYTKITHLERHDDPPKVRFVFFGVVHVLRVQHVVHGHKVPLLRKHPRSHPSQLLHVPPRTHYQPQVDAEGAHVRARLAAHPENSWK